MSVSLTKQERIARIDLRKKSVISLCKDIGIGNQIAKVACVIDISGSTQELFRKGVMQEAVERLIPIGLKFDDNGEIDMWDFSSDWGPAPFNRLPSASLENFDGYVNREIMPHHGGGTEYAPVLQDLFDNYKPSLGDGLPVFVMFFTDGDNEYPDKPATEELIREMSNYAIFVQFIGLGRSSKEFLEHLSELAGTALDCCGYFNINDIDNTDDNTLYRGILNEFPQWLKLAHEAGVMSKLYQGPPPGHLGPTLEKGSPAGKEASPKKSLFGFFGKK